MSFSDLAVFFKLNLVKIQDSFPSEFQGCFRESKGKERKEGLLPPLRSAWDRC